MKRNINLTSLSLRISVLALVASVLMPSISMAQDNEIDDTTIIVDGVPVKPEKHIPQLLDSSNGQLARFEGPFCPHISGLPEKYARDLEDKVRENALSFGLTVPEKGCKANAVIIFTPVIDDYMTQLRKSRRTWFNSLSPRNRRLLTKTKRSYYAWHDTDSLRLDGTPTVGIEALNGFGVGSSAFVGLGSFGSTTDGTRINTGSNVIIANAFVVLDITKTNNMSFQQLADFSTFHLLVNVDEDREDIFLANSILNLFNVDDPLQLNTGLTSVDKLTIKALYNDDTNSVSAWQKSVRIARYVRKNYNNEKIVEQER